MFTLGLMLFFFTTLVFLNAIALLTRLRSWALGLAWLPPAPHCTALHCTVVSVKKEKKKRINGERASERARATDQF